MSTNHRWLKFWGTYRSIEAKCDDDLFFQVGKTVDKKRISSEAFSLAVERIREKLYLQIDDVLLDLCCGNGLLTYELHTFVKQINGLDFTCHLIDAAKELKSAPNISYFRANTLDPFHKFIQLSNGRPNKFLMNDALAYFQENDLITLIKNINTISGGDFIFFATGVPNILLKNKFYNTPQRRAEYQSMLDSGDENNKGLGKWWNPETVLAIAANIGVNCFIENQPLPLSNYRMDILFSTANN